MMYKIVIVEDEKMIREGIENGMPWNELGYEIAGSAANGLLALELINKTHPDVVLSDVKMPEMDGMQLIEALNADYPEIKIVLFTGYNEQEYYRKAIKNKVVDFLLKPTDCDEFRETFIRIRKMLDDELLKKNEYEKLNNQVVNILPYMKEKYLNDLIKGYSDLSNFELNLNHYNIDIAGNEYGIIIFEVDNSTNSLDSYTNDKNHMLNFFIKQTADILFSPKQQGVFFHGANDEIVGLCSFNSGIDSILSMVKNVQKKVHESRNITISAAISNSSSKKEDIPALYQQALQAKKQKVFLKDESIILYKDIQMYTNNDFDELSFDIDKIINIIFYDEEGSFGQLIDNVIAKFQNKILKNYEYIDNICLELLFAVSRNAQKMNFKVKDIMDQKNTSYNDIYKMNSLIQKRDWIVMILENVKDRVNELRQNSNSRVIDKVKYLLHQNYYKNGVSLEMIGEIVNKSPTYISSLFKAETGCNFSEYVTNLRMEKAKELLCDISLKTYEISEMLGYADVSHFTKVFKKNIGMSPAEFRENSRT